MLSRSTPEDRFLVAQDLTANTRKHALTAFTSVAMASRRNESPRKFVDKADVATLHPLLPAVDGEVPLRRPLSHRSGANWVIR